MLNLVVYPGCAARPWALECNRFAVEKSANIHHSETISDEGVFKVSQSLVRIYVHIVFSTKNRTPFLKDSEFRDRAHAYLNGICENQGSPSLKVGGVEDHVHILCRLSKTLDVSTLIRELKRDSSRWIKEENSRLADFYWQQGYGAFSVSPAHVQALKEYIANQEEHHRRETYQDEFRRLCKKYGVEIDERYVWD
jgi:REP element-mobilizing transposase RayT